VKLARAQYQSVYVRTIAYFSVAVGVTTVLLVVGGTVFFGLSAPSYLPDEIPSALFFAVVGGVFAAIFAWIGGVVASFMFGIGLNALAARLLRNVSDWRGYLAGAFGVGAISAAIPLVLYSLWISSLDDAGHLFANWSTILPVVTLVLLAASSSALAWHYVWRHPATVEANAALSEVSS
jgi:hypothetical protein